MYRACFEYAESQESFLYKNYLSNFVSQEKDLHTQNISIEYDKPYMNYVKIVIMLDILEDFTYELKSNFESYKDALQGVSQVAGNITGFFDKLNTVKAFSNITNKNADLMKTQVWKETEPFKMNFKFSLQTKTNPFVDVYLPAILLSSQTILSPIIDEDEKKNYAFRTPGVNRMRLSAESKGDKFQRLQTSKVLETFSILVRQIDFIDQGNNTNLKSDTEYPSDESVLSNYNSIVSLDYAFIETAKPTWSKERTSSGIPLWCELELTVQSVFSANDAMFGYIYPKNFGSGFSSAIKEGGAALGISARSKAVNYFR